ncbi:V-type ATPase [Lentithecium fluviatile CBS 122367]|uniref:V-type proton ATPase subunit G n=1 Tax=Lentithecium fluviatile CBS 122367 TaxID=1168545 RepID=A0A6G1IFQ4_9PLEO|nr:V-type ATPase [Lentithecium fluviatile CBS 122367]
MPCDNIHPTTPSLLKMSAQNSAGIQTLLDAEREAQKIVQQAREYRTKRVKDARSEAQKEIEEYRKEKEAEFQKFEKEHSSGNKKAEDDAKKDTDAKVQEIQGIGKKSGSKVVEQLIAAVTDPKPEPPRGRD